MKTSNEKVIEIIKSLNIVHAGSQDIKPNVSFSEQGIDSLDMMSIFLNIEEKFNLKIPDADIDKLVSVEKIVEYVNGVA
jgi:acyl carrier protein